MKVFILWSGDIRDVDIICQHLKLYENKESGRLLQRTYSWMKYYNNKLDISTRSGKVDEKGLEDLLQDVRKQINGSLAITGINRRKQSAVRMSIITVAL